MRTLLGYLATWLSVMCNCAENFNDLLAGKNMRLVSAMLIIRPGLDLVSRLCIKTEKIDPKIRKKLPPQRKSNLRYNKNKQTM